MSKTKNKVGRPESKEQRYPFNLSLKAATIEAIKNKAAAKRVSPGKIVEEKF